MSAETLSRGLEVPVVRCLAFLPGRGKQDAGQRLLWKEALAPAEWQAFLPVPASVPYHPQGSDGSFFGDKAYCHVHS